MTHPASWGIMAGVMALRGRSHWTTATNGVLAVVLATALGGCRQPVPASGMATISIVGTTDLHGRIDAADGRGGLAWLGGYLANLRAARAADRGAVLLVDSGDTFQGGITSNLSEGAIVIDAYDALGYTALAVGNHDFEFGAVDRWEVIPAPPGDPRGALKARAAQARFPFLAANLIDTATGQPVDWPNVRPSVLVDAAGVKVGLIGVMTAHALSMTLAANVRGLAVSPLAPAIEAEAVRLRAVGARVVVVVAHAGGACDAFDDPVDLASCHDDGEMFEVVRTLPRGLVDVVAGGHTHAVVAHEVNGVAIVQAHYWGQAFSRVDLSIDRGSGQVASRRIFQPQEICASPGAAGGCAPASAGEPAFYEGRPVTADVAVEQAMAAERARVAALRAEPLGVALEGAVRRGPGDGESPLGNLFADAMLAAMPGADGALSYSAGPGGLRADLAGGPLTIGAVYDTFPFDNRLARLDVTGADLRTLLTEQLQRPRWRGRALGVAGLRVAVRCRAGALDVVVTRDSGAAVRDDERLTIVTSDFFAARAAAAFRSGDVDGEDATMVRDAVLGWLRGHDGGIAATRFADPARPRWTTAPQADRCPPTG